MRFLSIVYQIISRFLRFLAVLCQLISRCVRFLTLPFQFMHKFVRVLIYSINLCFCAETPQSDSSLVAWSQIVVGVQGAIAVPGLSLGLYLSDFSNQISTELKYVIAALNVVYASVSLICLAKGLLKVIDRCKNRAKIQIAPHVPPTPNTDPQILIFGTSYTPSINYDSIKSILPKIVTTEIPRP